jgi:5-methylcytosine-specific restriction endonuclease McrA
MKFVKNNCKCIGITKKKNICNRKVLHNNIYCSIHKNKYKRKNTLNSIKPIIKREIIKLISHKSREELTNDEILQIHNAKDILTSSFTKCYICDNNNKKCLTIDHIIPIVNIDNNEYGKDIDSNMILCCSKCNLRKSNKGLEYVIEELTTKIQDKNKLKKKIAAINSIYKYKNKLLLKKIFIHYLSFILMDNILNIYNKFISKYMKYLYY